MANNTRTMTSASNKSIFIKPTGSSSVHGEAGRALKQVTKSSLQQFFPKGQSTPISPLYDRTLQAIEKSRKLLELPNDWDGEGSPEYAFATWSKAVSFIQSSSISLWRDHKKSVDAPKILPGPDGSIDVLWKNEQRELLINFPVDADEAFAYYGDNAIGQIVKGELSPTASPASNQWLLLWLMQ